ncbi:MAG: peptidoglycan DD-metalloendopeptidase family protein [Endomicrobium sp.]|jgi:septal ring factor EnvC (AmiA/AmiB activator)|nr:peptidoglycan DD-metalloendopeptidase family protein [Endomicrobium sp.]
MKIIKICFIAIFSAFCFSVVFAQDGDIKKQSRELSDVKKNIKQKQLEKDRLALKEKVFKRELKVLNAAIDANEKNLSKLALQISAAQKNLNAASKEYDRAYKEYGALTRALNGEIELYHKMTFLYSYEQNPFEYKVRQASLLYKKENYDKERKAAALFSEDIKKWEAAKNKLLSLRKRETVLSQEKKKLLKEKEILLAGTSGLRAQAEAEIKALNESAKALQTLINRLAEESKKKAAQAQPIIRAKDSSSKRRKVLSWPVEGKVIANFGRNKHPELDAYVISNGIKIKARDFSIVKSVDSGVVVFAGEFRSYGKVAIIDYKNAYFGVYGQLSEILVSDNQKVSKGSDIARLGKGQDSVLYFEIRQNNVPDNPILWLEKR